MVRSWVGWSFIVLFVVSVSMSQTVRRSKPRQASTTRDSTAIAVIQQSLAALGLPATSTLETIAQGTLTDGSGETSSLTVETAGVDRIRFNIGSDYSFVTNAGSGFVIKQDKRHLLAAWSTKYRRVDHLPSLFLMTEYQNPNFQAKYVALENVQGSPAHHLILTMLPSDGAFPDIEALESEVHVWIDQKSMLVVEARNFDFSPETPQNRSPVDTYFGNYQQQGEAQIPFHLIRYNGDQKTTDIVLSSIDLKATIPDSDFQ